MMSATILIGNESSNHIRIEILRYEREPVDDPFDSNWLTSTISVSCNAWNGKPFSASLQTSDFEEFQKGVLKLASSSKSEANFSTMEEQLEFKLNGNDSGRIAVEGKAIASRVPCCEMKFAFEIDQTYLPNLLAQLEKGKLEFPAR